MELWDAYDANFNKLDGFTLVRGEAIPDGVFHLVCDVIVQHVDGTYLLMQRDARKHYGGMWEATAGGSALRGETPLECAVRELKEETGISPKEIREVGKVVHHQNHSIYVEFWCLTEQEKESVLLQEGETQAYKWVSRDDLIGMSKDKLITERMQLFVGELN